MSRVEDFIQHYASEYYDPAKAHEYYLKNRALKGRSTSKMSDQQKEAWTYAKQKITDEKKLKIEALREKARQTRDRISQKLSMYAGRLNSNSEAARAERERIRLELKASIESIRSEYENIYQKEYDNILSKIKGKIPKSRKSSKSKGQQVDWETFDKT